MTKFENIGVQRQYEARNKMEADKAFEFSCSLCCNRGMHLECPGCSIEFAHDLMVNYFDSKRKA